MCFSTWKAFCDQCTTSLHKSRLCYKSRQQVPSASHLNGSTSDDSHRSVLQIPQEDVDQKRLQYPLIEYVRSYGVVTILQALSILKRLRHPPCKAKKHI